MWWQSCFQDSRAPVASEKWYNRDAQPIHGGKFYGGKSKETLATDNNSSRQTISINRCSSRNNSNDILSVGDKKPCAFYNERSVTKQFQMAETQEQQLVLLRNENRQLKQMVRELTPFREKYHKLRGQYLKKEKDLLQLEAKLAASDRLYM